MLHIILVQNISPLFFHIFNAKAIGKLLCVHDLVAQFCVSSADVPVTFSVIMNSVISVSVLQNIVFSQLSLPEKVELKSRGRPVPDLNIVQASSSRSSAYTRKFNREIYTKCEWLCGCEKRNALFCFPCLLFGGDSTWTSAGVTDLGHLTLKTKKHENSQRHLKNVVSLAMLGKVNIASHLSEAYRLNINKHNDEVRKNREILSKIIDCLKFCGNFELPIRGHDETIDSENPGVFRGLLDFAGKLDESLRNHFMHASVFKGNSKIIQNELLDCMLAVCRSQIQSEIESANFLAVMADDTTDVSERIQEVVVFRYEHEGSVKERFWGFSNPTSQDAQGLSTFILEQLDSVLKGSNEKLIAQTYDGAAVMSGEKNGVQSIVKQTYPNAHFIHCYAHQLNLIMEQAASQNSKVRIFFSDLSGISAFFSRSPQRIAVLEKICTRRVPRSSATRWNFNSRVVNTVYENLESLKECFLELQKVRTVATIRAASGHLRTLNDEEFLFWLSFFHRVMPHVDILYNQLQTRKCTSASIHGALDHFYNIIFRIRNEWPNVGSEVTEPSAKKRKCENLIPAAKEVCDTICFQIKERFKFTGHLIASKLLDTNSFALYNKQFPEKELDHTVAAYPLLNKTRFRTELSVLYERRELHEVSGVFKLFELIKESGLEHSFSEVFSLCKIVLTTPMTTAEAERCFSTLKRIKTFLRSTMSEERLSALAMLSIEKSLISSTVNFNEQVIDEFARRKERRMEFIYK